MRSPRAACSDAAPLTGYAKEVLADEPLAYYRLDESGGATAVDSVGPHPGAYGGTILFGAGGALAGDSNPGIRFDDSSSRLEVGGALGFAGRAAFTVEAWVRPRTIDGNVRFVMGSSSRSSASEDGYRLYFAQGFTLFTRTGAGQTAYASGPILGVGRYLHFASTYDGDRIRLYVDGREVGSAASAEPIDAHADTVLVFGDAVAGQYFRLDGELDEVAVYGEALSAARVDAHFKAATTP